MKSPEINKILSETPQEVKDCVDRKMKLTPKQMEVMKLKKGLKFRKFYNEGNINNIPYIEVRGIVDDVQIVLLCRKAERQFHKMIHVDEFNFNIKEGIYLPLETTKHK